MLRRPQGLLGQVNLAIVESLQEFIGGNVDKLDLVGALEDGIRHGFPHLDVGNLGNDVVQALHVLDVERRVDVDTGLQQVQDVLPSLGVPRARDVAVRQFVQQE